MLFRLRVPRGFIFLPAPDLTAKVHAASGKVKRFRVSYMMLVSQDNERNCFVALMKVMCRSVYSFNLSVKKIVRY